MVKNNRAAALAYSEVSGSELPLKLEEVNNYVGIFILVAMFICNLHRSLLVRGALARSLERGGRLVRIIDRSFHGVQKIRERFKRAWCVVLQPCI